MVDNLDEKIEENIALKSEDDETLSQKEIFDNCSSTVGVWRRVYAAVYFGTCV